MFRSEKVSAVGFEPWTVRSPVQRSNPLGHRAPQLWSIVTSGGSAFHNINITCSVTNTLSATNCLGYDTITDMMLLLLLRKHSDAFRPRKCIIPLAPYCDYSWHWTTPGPLRSWAESRRLLLARDYSWPVTPGSNPLCYRLDDLAFSFPPLTPQLTHLYK